jgi:membrane-associated protease RseP (regulator of RpoE activity)
MDKDKKPSILINLFLLLATIFTTMIAGAMLAGVNPLISPLQIIKGCPFSLTLLLILLAHESGHYIASKKHGVEATLPFLIPAPPPFLIGTFGAFIKMRAPVKDKNSLFDIGVAGPLAGVLVAIPVLIIGLKLSEVKFIDISPEKCGLSLGSSLLFELLSKLILGELPENYNIILHPIAFAGWIGLLVTALNLIPVGQLDGGHIAYAVFGERAEKISKVVLIILLVLGLFGWPGWLVWAALLLIMRLKHPPPLDFWTPLDKKRKALGWVTLAIFISTFTPVPFRGF